MNGTERYQAYAYEGGVEVLEVSGTPAQPRTSVESVLGEIADQQPKKHIPLWAIEAENV